MSISGVCLAFRFFAPALAVADGGVDSPRVSGIMAPKCAGIERRPVMLSQTTATFCDYLMSVLDWLVPFRVPQNIL